MRKKILAFLLAVCLAAGAPALPGSALVLERRFPDVPQGKWYYEAVTMLSALEIINGYPDGSFHPDDAVKRSEFIKMVSIASELVDSVTPERGVHWSERFWLTACENGLLDFDGQNVIPLENAALNRNISRYDMAVIVSNAMDNALMEDGVKITSPADAITDYAVIPGGYRPYVEQAYGKGVLTGFADGSFAGEDSLTRAQAATVIYRLLWNGQRVQPDFDCTVVKREVPTAPPIVPAGKPFAVYIQENNLVNAYGRPTPALCEMLFGSANKTCFASAADAAGYIADVEVPVWRINSAGAKYSTVATIQVHRLVAEDVLGIFTAIYNDPERFPISSVGGARYTDTLRHSWGCAIDVNPTQNAYGYYSGGAFVPRTGSGWWPGTNPYSITANGSVVNAFKAYGWGWGGQGYSSGWYDYMHFSIMPSGG